MTTLTIEQFLELKEYAEIGNDELCKTCNILLDLRDRDYALSGEFMKALEKELQEYWEYLTESYKIVEIEEKFTQKFKTLVPK